MFSAPTIASLLEDLHTISGLHISIHDTEFHELVSCPAHPSRFCALVQQNPKARARCLAADKEALERVRDTGKIHLYKCRFGLWEAACPLYRNGILVGYLMMGQGKDCTCIAEQEILDAALRYTESVEEVKTCLADLPALSKETVTLVFENIEDAYNDGKNIKARENMLVASYHAGLAFTRAYVGYVHAIAHNLGGFYGIPHGLANAVILPYVLEYYGSTAHFKLARLAEISGVKTIGSDKDKAEAFIEAIKTLNKNMNIPDGFDMIKEEDIPTIVARALKEGNPLYPVPKIMDKADCEAVIRRLMK